MDFYKFALVIIVSSAMALCYGCSFNSTKGPEFHSEIVLDEDLNITDWGRSGQSTPDDNYYYYGSVTLYSEDGRSKDFTCYLGKHGSEEGCRGVIYHDKFYNLDRNKWVNIGGVKYKAADITN